MRSVLLVGNPSLHLKGFDVAISVLAAVNQVVPLHITWVCQTQPTAALVPALLASGLRIHLHVNPPQVQLLSCVSVDSCQCLRLCPILTKADGMLLSCLINSCFAFTVPANRSFTFRHESKQMILSCLVTR